MTITDSAALADYCKAHLAGTRQHIRPTHLPVTGRITQNNGLLLQATGCVTRRGEICRIDTASGGTVKARVVSFHNDTANLVLMDKADLLPGAVVTPTGQEQQAPIGPGLLGRVIDSCGQPLDELGPIDNVAAMPIEPESLSPLERAPIDQPLDVGVRAINSLLSIGRGQRIGLFAASGLGKSVLLGMMAEHTDADITIVCLLGERGREIQEFIHHVLGPEGLRKSVVIAIPADHTPLRRLSGARYATAVANYFRSQGLHVLLLLDSLTRYAHAGREIALASGEFPVSGGYPSSVLTELPLLLENGGCTDSGSITAIYTLLMESGDKADPLAEAAKSILDGHIVLSRELAESGHYPAIDVLASTSRLKDAVTNAEHQQASQLFIYFYSVYQRNKDLLSVGMYQRGDNPDLDKAIDLLPAMLALLTQSEQENVNFNQCRTALLSLFNSGNTQHAGHA